ncbi:MAG: hypothetical protein EOO28_12470 [Comamonadaceae bacterium]|nr:MAG: hypothetical protein EOO28_12470 [Comamonadaceae bacterium]
MSNFFVSSNPTVKPPAATPANADNSFSVAEFSASQKAHAYAEVEAQASQKTMQTSPSHPASDTSFSAVAAQSPDDSGPRSHRRAWAAGIAFFTTVFASMAAAATVASSDFPLMIVGL